jgi:ParB/RepB/Spo0J family partition protein
MSAAVAAAADAAVSQITFASKGKGKDDSAFQVVPFKNIHVVKGFNPRKDLGDFTALTADIRKNGLQQPLVVRPADKEGHYNLVAGERRYRSLEKIGATDVPVIIKSYDSDLLAKAAAMAENSDDARKSIGPVATAMQFKEFSKSKWSSKQIAERTGYHEASVKRYLELAEADKPVLDKVDTGAMSYTAALAFNRLEPKTRKLIEKDVEQGATEARVKELAKAALKGTVTTPGKKANKQKSRTARDATLRVWKKPKVKDAMIANLANIYVNPTDEDDVNEVRGALGYALWDRGDIEAPGIPDFYNGGKKLVPTTDEGTKEDRAEYKRLYTLINSEAKKHKPAETPAETTADAVAGTPAAE